MSTNHIKWSITIGYLVINSIANAQDSTDILDFMPAVISATQSNKEKITMPRPPIGQGNFRVVKVEVIRTTNPIGTLSENILTWNNSGNPIQEKVSAFNLFEGNPSQIIQLINVQRSFNKSNHPVSESFSRSSNNSQESGNKQFIYNNSRLSKIISTSTANGIMQPRFETVFQYNTNGRLEEATTTASKNSIVVSTKKHSIGYTANRVTSMQVTFNSETTSQQTTYTYEYNTAGNLTKAVILSPFSTEVTRIYQPLSSKQQITQSTVRDTSTGNIIAQDNVVSTYARGICTLQNANTPVSIENTINGLPYSSNIGCIVQ